MGRTDFDTLEIWSALDSAIDGIEDRSGMVLNPFVRRLALLFRRAADRSALLRQSAAGGPANGVPGGRGLHGTGVRMESSRKKGLARNTLR